jgi:hypothetical protein
MKKKPFKPTVETLTPRVLPSTVAVDTDMPQTGTSTPIIIAPPDTNPIVVVAAINNPTGTQS